MTRRCVTSLGLASLLLLVSGCRRMTPVQEISPEKSGIELRESLLPSDAAWPQWRGAHGGHIPDNQLPIVTQWSESQNVVWQAEIPGRGHSSPIVVRDLVVLATAIEQETESEQQQVLGFDRLTGQRRWETTVHRGGFPSPREVHAKSSHANATLASDGRLVYAAFLHAGKIVATALDLQGEIAWQTELGAFVSKFGFAPSPVIYQSFVIFAADNLGGGYIAALDGHSGKIAWRVARPAVNSHSSPTIARLGDRDQLLICGCDRVVSYDPANGQQIWSEAYTTETTCGTMVVQDDRAFASGGYPGKQTVCLDPQGKLLWKNDIGIYEPSLLATGELLFAVADNGIAYCWSAATGETHWRQRLGGQFSASPILCEDKLYVSDLSGKTYVFRAIADRYEQVAVNRLGSDCYASPAVADGQLFLRVGVGLGANRRERLYCLGTKNSAEDRDSTASVRAEDALPVTHPAPRVGS